MPLEPIVFYVFEDNNVESCLLPQRATEFSDDDRHEANFIFIVHRTGYQKDRAYIEKDRIGRADVWIPAANAWDRLHGHLNADARPVPAFAAEGE